MTTRTGQPDSPFTDEELATARQRIEARAEMARSLDQFMKQLHQSFAGAAEWFAEEQRRAAARAARLDAAQRYLRREEGA